MEEEKPLVLSILSLTMAAWIFVVGAIRYDLTVSAGAMEAMPMTLVIDAGHGGEDGGAVSCTGTRESQINLEIALRLEQISALCGIRPAMIRREDRSVYTEGDSLAEKKISDLHRRVGLTEQYTPAILVSIHQNYFPQSQYHGAQVFYGQASGGKELAELTRTALRQFADPGNRREIRRADGIYLMERVSCPCILVESGFLSNPREAETLETAPYQKKLACAIAGAVAQYLEEGNHFI